VRRKEYWCQYTEGEGITMGGCVHSTPLFIMFVRNEHGGLMVVSHERTRTNREPVLSRRKKKVLVETACRTKRASKLFQVQASTHRRRRSENRNHNHNSRIIEPTERYCFVECGIYILANSGAGVVFNLGVTTGYALTEFVDIAAHDPQQFHSLNARSTSWKS